MPLKPSLRVVDVGRVRLVVGVLVGLAFGASFYAASIAVARPGFVALQSDPRAQVERFRGRYEPFGEAVPDSGPVIVAEPEPKAPGWAEPFWAGVAAAFGHAVTLAFLFWRPARRSLRRFTRHRLHVQGGVATGLMWGAVVPLVFVELWFDYSVLVAGGTRMATAFGQSASVDPFLSVWPFGASGALLVLLLALEPWRGIQRRYRCGYWPAIGVLAVVGYAAVLYGAGRLVLQT